MIGNDIVDLKLAEVQSIWWRQGFLDKTCTTEEQAMIHRSEMPDQLLWRFWSMKESAYKSVLRLEKKIKLNPLAFQCRVIDQTGGRVIYGDMEFNTVSSANDDFVNTIAYSASFEKSLHERTIRIDPTENPSKMLRQAVIEFNSRQMGCGENEMEIRKNPLGIPELYLSGEKTPAMMSLSHHGRYGSFVITNRGQLRDI